MKKEAKAREKFEKCYLRYLHTISLYPEMMQFIRFVNTFSQNYNYLNLAINELSTMNKTEEMGMEMGIERAEEIFFGFVEKFLELEKTIIEEDLKQNKYKVETHSFDIKMIREHAENLPKYGAKVQYLRTILKEYQTNHLPIRRNFFNFQASKFISLETFVAQKILLESIKDEQGVFFEALQMPDIGKSFEELMQIEIQHNTDMLLLRNEYPEDFEGNVVYQLPDSFNYENKIVKAKRLESIEVAILFRYLKEFDIIGDFEWNSLSKLAHFLTGYAQETLRKNFTSYFDDKKKEAKGKRNSELHFQKVKEALEDIIGKIDKEISSIKEKQKM